MVNLYETGDRFSQPDLAKPLRGIKLAVKGFYAGETVDLINKEMKNGEG